MSKRPEQNGSPELAQLTQAQDDLVEEIGRVGRWRLCAVERCIVLSAGATNILESDPDETRLRPAEFASCFGDDEEQAIRRGLRDLQQGKPLDLHATVQQLDGQERFVRLKAIPFGDPESGSCDGVGIIQDLTEIQNVMMALASAHERQEDYSELATEWMWETDEKLRYTYISAEMTSLLDMPVHECIGLSRAKHLAELDDSLEMEMHLHWLEQQRPYVDYRYTVEEEEDQKKYLASSGKPVFDGDGVFKGYRGIERDLTESEQARDELVRANRRMNAANKEKSDAMASLKEAYAMLEEQNEKMIQAQEEIHHRAFHDPLTGVGNRHYLEKFLASSAQECQEEGRWLGLLHLDLDRFKEINDSFGHAAGDAVLNHVAEVLEIHTGEDSFVARVGGDEFVVVCMGDGGENLLSDLAQSLIDELSKPYDFEGNECWFGASIGIATMHGTEIKSTELMINADMALYRAKNTGRGRYEFFSTDVQSEIRERKSIADGIRAGLPRGEFLALYQPQICAQTYRVTGCEALARWRHPQLGLLAPDKFMPIAEEINLMPEIDRVILDTAIGDLWSWEHGGVDIPKVSVNLSARRLLDHELVDYLKQVELPLGKLAFELLESVFLDDIEDMIAWNIDTLKEMGFEIELDDFGSGHASLTSLVNLAPDTIKIDRGLVSAIVADPVRRNLLRSIVGIGKSLGVRIIAEGVETRDQAKILSEFGCDVLQGYLIARPMPATELADFLRTWPARLPREMPAEAS